MHGKNRYHHWHSFRNAKVRFWREAVVISAGHSALTVEKRKRRIETQHLRNHHAQVLHADDRIVVQLVVVGLERFFDLQPYAILDVGLLDNM